jgi:hypothetical protein
VGHNLLVVDPALIPLLTMKFFSVVLRSVSFGSLVVLFVFMALAPFGGPAGF